MIAWDRAAHPTDSEHAVRAFILETAPNAVAHIGTGAPEWAEWIARTCSSYAIPLLWTGSVSVFGPGTRAPLAPDTPPDATDDYGRYKITCERLVREANPRAIVARLGWQVDAKPGSNTMTDYLSRRASENGGRIEASRRWTPSSAWLPFTAEALVDLLDRAAPGLYHLEGNRGGMTFHDLASAIAGRLGVRWTIVPTDDPHQDNRMSDPRVTMRQLSEALPPEAPSGCR